MTPALPAPGPVRHPVHGVTLIEMMVVLVIVAVMAGLAMTGLYPGSSARKLSGAADVLVQRLALASDEAMVTGRPIALDAQTGGYGFVQWQGAAGWQPVKDGPLAQRTRTAPDMQVLAFGQDGADRNDVGPLLIAPGGDAEAFRVELEIAGQRRIVLFDGLNAREIIVDAGAG